MVPISRPLENHYSPVVNDLVPGAFVLVLATLEEYCAANWVYDAMMPDEAVGRCWKHETIFGLDAAYRTASPVHLDASWHSYTASRHLHGSQIGQDSIARQAGHRAQS